MQTSKQELINESHYFEALFNNSTIGIVVVNSKSIIQSINPFALNLFEYYADEIIGKPIEILIPNRYHHNHVKSRDAYSKNPKNRTMGIGMDLFALKKDGLEFPAEVSLGIYENSGEKFTIAFISNITVRKKAELEVKKLNDELEDSVLHRTKELTQTLHELELSKEELSKSLVKEKELNELKSRFVSMASHEFRTPLSTILSSASLVAKYKDTAEQENREKHINRIKNSVNSLTDLLNEFLSLGKIEEGKISTNNIRFNLKEMLENTCNEMQALSKNNQQLIYTHTGEELVFLDVALLKNVILNLLSNAIKFSQENSDIIITSKSSQIKTDIIIKDFGIGINIEDQKHLFERFFRAENATNFQGTGLGLHIAQKSIEIMNGTIAFK
ncbi:MAG: PAS domain-containing sensor histidine kinase, partial [Ferruginibacter sp.]